MATIRQERPADAAARRCSTSPMGRSVSPRCPSACAKAACRSCRWSLRRPPHRRHRAAVAGDGRPGPPALLLGPLAVDPECRNRGIGSALVRRALRDASRLGHGAVLLVGDAPYHGRFGFEPEDRRTVAAGTLRAAPAARPRAQGGRARWRARGPRGRGRPQAKLDVAALVAGLVAATVAVRTA